MKKKAVVKAELITPKKEEAKIYKWIDYQCIFTGSMKPMNANGIERLAVEVVNWAYNDSNALKMTQFYHSKGIHNQTWLDWCDKFPELKKAHDLAKAIIGDRREIGALHNNYNASMIAYTMPFYDPEWKEETARRAALKEGSSGDGKITITVVTDSIPNSPLVPERKKDE